jgi:thiamine-phosphate pyrophosphorylase
VIGPVLIAITSTELAPLGVIETRLARCVERARPGSVAIQLRDHDLSARARLELGRRLLALGAPLIVNDRLDLALALGVSNVHLGERSMSPKDARRLIPNAWISQACHDPERAGDLDADAILLSPVLAPRKGRPALGLPALARARARLSPGARLYALGGVDAESARACLDAGADGVAVQGAVLDGREPDPLLAALGIRRG